MSWLRQKFHAFLESLVQPEPEYHSPRQERRRQQRGETVTIASSCLVTGPEFVALGIELSSGESHCWKWSRGREADVRVCITNRAAAGDTDLNWSHAAWLNCVVRDCEKSAQG